MPTFTTEAAAEAQLAIDTARFKSYLVGRGFSLDENGDVICKNAASGINDTSAPVLSEWDTVSGGGANWHYDDVVYPKVKYAPPTQSSPTTVNIRNGSTGYIEYSIDGGSYTSHDELVDLSLEFDEDEDVIVTFADEVVTFAELTIQYGRHVRVIGGHLQANSDADNDGTRAILRFAGTYGSAFVEGVLFDCNDKLGMDAIEVGALGHQDPKPAADIYVQRCRVINSVTEDGSSLHSDAFQLYGAVGNVYIVDFTCYGQYQGLFLSPQHDITSYHLENINAGYTDPDTGAAYAITFFNPDNYTNDDIPPFTVRNVHVQARNTDYSNPQWPNDNPEAFSIMPAANYASNGGKACRNGDEYTFPQYDKVDGVITIGAPSFGDFVTAEMCGSDYVSAGYDGYASGYVEPSIANAAPSFTENPVIDNSLKVGRYAHVTNGNAGGYPYPTFTYQWKLDGVDISGQTGQTLSLTSDYIGGTLSCLVTATNSEGSDSVTVTASGAVYAYLDSSVSGVLAEYIGSNSDSGDGTDLLNILGDSDWDLSPVASTSTAPVWDGTKKRFIANHDGYFEFGNSANLTELLNAHKNSGGQELTFVYHGFMYEHENGGIIGGARPENSLNGFSIEFRSSGADDGICFCDGANRIQIVDQDSSLQSMILIVSWNPNETTDNLKVWFNSRTSTTYSFSFDTSSDATADYFVWGYDDGLGAMLGTVNENQEVENMAFIDHMISNSEANDIIDYYQTLTGEPLVNSDTGDATSTDFLIIEFDAGNTAWYINDLAIEDSEGNDLVSGLTIDNDTTLLTTRREVQSDTLGAIGNGTSGAFAHYWNDAAWDDGDDPVLNSGVTALRDSSINRRQLRVVVGFSSTQNIGKIKFFEQDISTRPVPDIVRIYNQDGVLTPTDIYADVDDYIYDNGADDRAYEITF